MTSIETVLTEKSEMVFTERSYFANKIKTDIYESKFSIVVQTSELEKFSSKNGFKKSEFEIVPENKYVHNQKVGFDYYLISSSDKIKIALADSVANRISEAKVEGEAIMDRFYENRKAMNIALFKKKISDFGNRVSIDVTAEEIRNTDSPVIGWYSISVPAEHLEFTEIMPYVDSLSKTYYSMVEIEKRLLDFKIARIDEYMSYLAEEKARLKKFSTEFLGKVNIIEYVDVEDVSSDSKEDLLEKLKNIHNYLSKHGGKIRNLETKYDTDKISGLVLNIKKISEFEGYFDVIEVGFKGTINSIPGASIADYLTDYSKFEKNFVDSLMGRDGGLIVGNMDVNEISAIDSQVEDNEKDSFYDKAYVNNIKSAKKILLSGKDAARVDSSFYVKDLNREKVMDLAIYKLCQDYQLNDMEKSVMDSINVYLKVTVSNYKTF